MNCWNCAVEVPTEAFCVACGAALPDPVTRRREIERRLGELSTERSDLESQLQRLSSQPLVAASNESETERAARLKLLPPPPTSLPILVAAGAPSSPATPTAPTTPRRPLFTFEMSPATVVALIGVVLLAAASFVSAKEHPALISLSHGIRLLALFVELALALLATVKLSRDRTMLADAFGVLTWSAALSLGLLATVNISSGLRADLWTYSIPFIVGAATFVLSRSKLELTRFVALGTLAFGLVHLAFFGLHPNVNGTNFASEVSMGCGVLVMVVVSLMAAGGLWVALSPRLADLTWPDRLLAFLTIGLLIIFSMTTPLPDVTTTSTGLLAALGLFSLALPFITGAVALMRRAANMVAVTIFAVTGGLISLVVVTSAALGYGEPITVFPGSHVATLWFPVLLGVIGLVMAGSALRQPAWSRPLWILSAVSLIPSFIAVGVTIQFELNGWLGRGGLNDAVLAAPIEPGWFGHDTNVADVSPLVIALSAAVLAAVVFAVSRVRTLSSTVHRTAEQLCLVIFVFGTLAVAMRYSDPAASTVIFAMVFAVVGAGTFCVSRLLREEARVDEWLPGFFLGGGLRASLFYNDASAGGSGYRPGGVTMAILAVVSLLGLTSALRRRNSWQGLVGAAVVLPSLSGIFALHGSPRALWQIVLVALAGVSLILGLTAERTKGNALPASSRTGLLIGGAFTYVAQFTSIVQATGETFRLVLLLASFALVLATAQRRGAQLPTPVLLVTSAVAGLSWALTSDQIYAPALWVAAVGFALLALLHGTDEKTHASWNEWGPALVFTMIPANYAALRDGWLSAAIAISAAIILVVVGVQLKKRAVIDVAIATFALLSVARLTQVVSDKGRWIAAVVIGVVLIANGIWRETRKKKGGDDTSTTSWYRSLN